MGKQLPEGAQIHVIDFSQSAHPRTHLIAIKIQKSYSSISYEGIYHVIIATASDGRPIQVAAEAFHSTVLFSGGAVYTFGAQFGVWHDCSQENASIPVRVQLPENEKAKLVACGTNFTAIATESNHLYTYGDSRYGKLGRLSHNAFPTLVDTLKEWKDKTPFEIASVDCGSNSTVILVNFI
jgi:alpha-tubulin suppressor-like RCC1 family protein